MYAAELAEVKERENSERHQKEEERRQKEEERRQKISLIKLLLANGSTIEQISLTLGLSMDELIRMLDD